MIEDMPRDLPPHLNRQRTQHGKIVYYVRIRKGPRTRMRAAYGSEAFWTEYRAAISGDPLPALAIAPSAGSLTWLWDRYRDTGAWTTEISHATRRQRENIMRHVLAASGAEPYTKVNEASIIAGIEKRSKTPSAARNFLDTMQGLFRWAKKAKHVRVDPTAGEEVKAPKRKKGKGFPAWIRADVEAYCRRWPLGTRQRVWLAVVLFTGLRRGDLAVVGKQHVRDGVITLRTEKGGETITVTLPVLPPLQEALDAGPIGDLAWICGARGEPFVKESLGNAFSEAAREAGVKKSLHGVRKIAATIAAENGATGKELDAIFGWVDGGKTSAIYTAAADRVRLAKAAMGKLDETGTSTPSPIDTVRAAAEISK